MPLYGFICEECNEEFEELVMSSTQIDSVRCPNCDSQKVQRKLSLVAALSKSGGSQITGACGSSG